MPITFRQIRASLAPRWLTEGDGGLVGYSLDLVKDAFMERLRLGHLARFPQQGPDGTPGPADALAALGRDRRVVRGWNETAERYATRCLRWLDDRKQAGNAYALMQKLAEYVGDGSVIKVVDAQGNWFVRDTNGTNTYYLKQANWEWDSHPIDTISGKRRWSRFWVIIHPVSIWTTGPGTYGGGLTWGESGKTWGTNAVPEQVADVRAIVADWKRAGTRCVNIIIAFDPASFDPLAAVSDPGMPNYLWEGYSRNVGGVQVPVRLDTARYWQGV